jgi:hypothetical protein
VEAPNFARDAIVRGARTARAVGRRRFLVAVRTLRLRADMFLYQLIVRGDSRTCRACLVIIAGERSSPQKVYDVLVGLARGIRQRKSFAGSSEFRLPRLHGERRMAGRLGIEFRG